LGITLEEVQENFGRGVKLHFAVNNISDPMGAHSESEEAFRWDVEWWGDYEGAWNNAWGSTREFWERKWNFILQWIISRIQWRLWGEWRSI
jgi:hypothetical protein